MRGLAPGQAAEVRWYDIASGTQHLLHRSTDLLLEAPNWSPDGERLVLNAGGRLHSLALGGGVEPIDTGSTPPLNNDHVLSPDGSTCFASTEDGRIYALDLDGVAEPRALTEDSGPGIRRYLHGISPDGRTLAYVLLREHPDGRVSTDIATVPVAGGTERRLTDDVPADDGPDFSPDGEWICFNSERASTRPGHAQLFRIGRDGGVAEQLTFDDRVNWFPHPAPDGSGIAYLSYPPGTEGHPADREVIIRFLSPSGRVDDLARVTGGQGTMNVPNWHPESTGFAFVAYPGSSRIS